MVEIDQQKQKRKNDETTTTTNTRWKLVGRIQNSTFHIFMVSMRI